MSKSWEIEGFLEEANGRLNIDRVSASALAEQFGTPLFVFSESRIRGNIAQIKRSENAIHCQLKVCYAAKANSTMAILGGVRGAGCDIEVNSGGELWKALKAGFTGEQIIFNGTSKEPWEIEDAINAGIYAIQVDSLYELSLIEETARRLGTRAKVSLRLVPEIESGTYSGLQTALLTSKFGMMRDEAYAAFAKYKDSPNLDLRGIHLHIGSQNPDANVYTTAFLALFDSMTRIHRETGVKIKHVNLGGGFPVDYLAAGASSANISNEQQQILGAHFEPADALKDAWNAVKQAADTAGNADLLDGLTILLEPGRSIIADAGICLTTVRNLKQRPLSDAALRTPHSALENWLLTDAGFNILLSMETYKWYYHLISAACSGEPHQTPYKVAGPLCDGGDVYFDIEGTDRLPDHRMLPENIQPGEVLALLNCGAYTIAQESQYNGRFRPAVLLIKENGQVKLVRKRESFQNLIENDV